MYMTVEEFIKQSWSYILATLKYLKEVSGVPIYTEPRKTEFKQISVLLGCLGALEGTSIEIDSYYKVSHYSTESFTSSNT